MDVTDILEYNHYKVRPNSGKGDCFFLALEQALGTIGIETSVHELRKVVADSLTQDQLEMMKEIYESAIKSKEVGILVDYSFMGGVETLDQLKAKVMTAHYSGDEIAVHALERELQINIVILQLVGDRYVMAAHPNNEVTDLVGYVILHLDPSIPHYELMLYQNKGVLHELPEELQAITSTVHTSS